MGADRLAPYGVLLWRKSGYAVRLIRDHRFLVELRELCYHLGAEGISI